MYILHLNLGKIKSKVAVVCMKTAKVMLNKKLVINLTIKNNLSRAVI